MCADGVDLGHTCRLCGKPLLSCWDDGPSISWHADEDDARACDVREVAPGLWTSGPSLVELDAYGGSREDERRG